MRIFWGRRCEAGAVPFALPVVRAVSGEWVAGRDVGGRRDGPDNGDGAGELDTVEASRDFVLFLPYCTITGGLSAQEQENIWVWGRTKRERMTRLTAPSSRASSSTLRDEKKPI